MSDHVIVREIDADDAVTVYPVDAGDGVTVVEVPSDSVILRLIDTDDDPVILRVPDSAVRSTSLPGTGPINGGSLNPIVDWFTGVGPPPDALIGAGPGDMYIDVESGILYQLR